MHADVISVVEAAYRVELGDEEWLRGILESALPSLGEGRPSLVYEYDAREPSRLRLGRMAMHGMPEGLTSDLLAQSLETADAEYVRATWRSVPCALASETPGIERQPAWSQLRAMGISEIVAINGLDPAGTGIWLGQLCPEPPRFGAQERRIWGRIAAHLSAGLRLRRRLGREGAGKDLAAGADAILHPRGKVEHAEGDAATKPALDALRDAAVALDRARGPMRRRDPDDAVAGWKGLVDARWSLVDHFERDGRRYIVARSNEPGVAALDKLTARERQVVSYASFGHTNKCIAYELGLSDSTVRVLMARAAAKLGVKSRADLVALVARTLEGGEISNT